MEPPFPDRSRLLPLPHERVAFVNIFLLTGLGWAARMLYLVAGATRSDRDFGTETALAAVIWIVVSLGAFTGWQIGMRQEVFGPIAKLLEYSYWKVIRRARVRPLLAIWLAGAAGVLVSCYPIIFDGRSFVSPDHVFALLYNQTPRVPNPQPGNVENVQRSDTFAMMWQTLPYSVIEHRAIFQDHELPVWNRYDAGGLTLLGQGQSMIGDPLHWAVVLTGGSAWAWDVKFLLARLLFAAGIGFCVRAMTGRLAAAVTMAFGACFFGFFIYRFNHPANFTLCYSPWILFAWLSLVPRAENQTLRATRVPWAWAALLLVACWEVFNSGTIKEAVVLLASLNAVGVGVLICDERRAARWKFARLGQALWMGVCFLLLSAPLWRTFLEALAHSWNAYSRPQAFQLEPGLFIGLFDDIFYRQFNEREEVVAPSANFLVLLGLAFVVGSFRSLAQRHRAILVMAVGALVPLVLIFGVVPSEWICAVPFLANISRIDHVFTCVLLILLPVLAGVGLEHCRSRLSARDFAWDWGLAAATILGLAALFQGMTHAAQKTDFSPLAPFGGAMALSSFFRADASILLLACLAVPWLLWWWRSGGAAGAWGAVPWLVICTMAMLWRGGLQSHELVGWDNYAIHPGPRFDVRTRSPAVDHLLAAVRREPGTCLGFNMNLMGGFIATYGLESPVCVDALQNSYFREIQDKSPTPRQGDWFVATAQSAASPLRRLYDLLNVRYYGASIVPGSNVQPIIRGLNPLGRYDLDLYESSTAWPRAFYTASALRCRTLLDVYHALGSEGGKPFAAIVPEEIAKRTDAERFSSLWRGPGQDTDGAVIPATAYHFTSRSTSFRVNAPGPGIVVLSEGFQTPYNEQIYVNGTPAEHFRVNWAFSGVRLPAAGEYQVRVLYGPRDLNLLLGASALGLLLLVGTGAMVVRRERGTAPG